MELSAVLEQAFLGGSRLEYTPPVQGFRARPIPLLLLLALACCRFDTAGLPPRPDLPRIEPELSLPDLHGDLGDLRVGEGAVGPCQGKPEGAPSCRFDDATGSAGVCLGGAFSLRRHCFVEAPCLNGLCVPSAIDDCAGACPTKTQVCAGFLNAGKIVTACVTPNPKNGAGASGSACSTGQACSSGHCAASGTCYRPCSSVVESCPAGATCRFTTIAEGAGQYSVSSCQTKAGGDAGIAPPDLGSLDGKAASE